MPYIESSSYSPPWWFRNAHLQTLYPTFFRRAGDVRYSRRRIDLDDGDFLDLDCTTNGGSRAAILLHGLASSSRASYMTGMALALQRRGWDAVAVNLRGSSGVPNRKRRLYHSGATEDLHEVVRHVTDGNRYEQIALIGFSLGGNIVINYVARQGRSMQTAIAAAAAVSVPGDLRATAEHMTSASNRLYMRRFMFCLRRRLRAKAELLPPDFDWDAMNRATTFREFDGLVTAPFHGFRDAEDYWEQCSIGTRIGALALPTLLITAEDDPFIPTSCYPIDQARMSPALFFEMPRHGGHLGFVSFGPRGEYWHETRICAFLEACVRKRGENTPQDLQFS